MILRFDEIKAILNSFFDPRSEIRFVTVFGSFASGKVHESSDIDIAIYGLRSFRAEELVEMSTQLAFLLGTEVDLIDLSKSHGALLEEALIKGQKILQRSPADFELLLKKLWYDKADDGLYRQRTQQLRLSRWIK